jgi:hypothetical protein
LAAAPRDKLVDTLHEAVIAKMALSDIDQDVKVCCSLLLFTLLLLLLLLTLHLYNVGGSDRLFGRRACSTWRFAQIVVARRVEIVARTHVQRNHSVTPPQHRANNVIDTVTTQLD